VVCDTLRVREGVRMWKILAVIMAVGCGSTEPDDSEPPKVEDSGEPLVDFDPLRALIQEELDTLQAVGVAVAIAQQGEVVFSEGFGFKDPEENAAMEASTLMRIGSVTKMMTATAVLAHVDEGNVALDASLGTYLPDFVMQNSPEASTDVQIQHLLSHQAAFADYTPIDGGSEDSLLESHANDVYAAYYALMAPPGAMYNYSNPNYALAGLVLEKTAGQPYREEMSAKVFEPLGMDRTFFLAEEVLADGDYATASTVDYWSGLFPKEAVVGPDSYDDAFSRPAGFAWSSVGDLLKFAEFAMHGKPDLMPYETSSLLMSEQVNTLEYLDVISYGFGWQLQAGYYWGLEADWLPLGVVAHSGAIPGYSAFLLTVPEHDLVIAVLANGDGSYFVNSVYSAIELLVTLPEPGVDPLSLVDDLAWDAYEGAYLDDFNVGRIEVVLEGAALMAYMPDLDAIGYPYVPELVPSSPGNFVQTVGDYAFLVTFIPDQNGEITYFRTRHYVGTRVEEPPAAGPTPDPQRLTESLRRLHRPDLIRPAFAAPR
jgi:CubicO group peptidase (beta-lactamase class C family)